MRQRGQMERAYAQEGLQIAGVDEVGRGCLAGPVYAACVVLEVSKLKRLSASDLELIRDSKTLSGLQRRRIVPVIESLATEFYVGSACQREIEQLGILQASFLAMRRALALCKTSIDILLVDGHLPLSGYEGRQKPIVKGDNLCYSIAAASILAKETRDKYMQEQAEVYPVYGFDSHVGYATKQHLASISRYGICDLHRRTFKPIASYGEQAALFQPVSLRDGSRGSHLKTLD